MIHTEQMREAWRKVRPYLEDGANHGDDAVELLKLVDEALTTLAAEPEPVGEVFIDTQGRPVPKLYGNVSLTDGVKLYAAATAAEVPDVHIERVLEIATALRKGTQNMPTMREAAKLLEDVYLTLREQEDARDAAEVPEAMGDERINSLAIAQWGDMNGFPLAAHRAFARAIIAARDAQWQSTRLLGGVPDDESEHDVMMGMAADDQVRIETLTIHLRSVIEIARTWQPDYATKMDRDMLDLAEAALPALGSTAAPQAPAPAVDAGVVRDAERYMGLTEAHDAIDAAMSAQAGKGGAA